MEKARYKVIVSTQEHYSVWPDEVEPPLGWDTGEVQGSLVACLDYIADVWQESDYPTDAPFNVIIDEEDDMLSVNPAGYELPSGWQIFAGPAPLRECLAAIKNAWTGEGPLPVQLSSPGSEDEAEEVE